MKSSPSPMIFQLQLYSSGDLNVEEMKKFLFSELFKEDWQKELAEKIIPKCLKEKYGQYLPSTHLTAHQSDVKISSSFFFTLSIGSNLVSLLKGISN